MLRGIDYDNDDLMGNITDDGNSGGKRKKGNNRLAIAVLGSILGIVLALMIAGTILSPTRGQCKKIVGEFQTCCNQLDMSGMLSCMKPSLLTTGLAIGSSVFSPEAVADFFSQFGGSSINGFLSGTGMTLEEAFRSITIEPKRFGFPRRTRRVRCKTTIGNVTGYMDFFITKVYGDPYIVSVRAVTH